ncbi:uncharacterized protein [Amphiura filiformis]|uniref:uncharacterized protein n=1 Tax=Amphiura filiformis TaxID=82378 RepID=UPI003B2125F6
MVLYIMAGTSLNPTSLSELPPEQDGSVASTPTPLQPLIQQSSGKAVYVRWGRKTCPEDTTSSLVYEGIASGSHHAHTGSGANLLCLPMNPDWDQHSDGFQTNSFIYGVEFEVSAFNPFSMENAETLQDHDVPCAVCLAHRKSVATVVPAKTTCPSGWTKEYGGYIMSSHFQHHRSEYICVDNAPEVRQGGYTSQDGSLLYPTEGKCGTLPCSPYFSGRELTCSVCTI